MFADFNTLLSRLTASPLFKRLGVNGQYSLYIVWQDVLYRQDR